MGRPSDYNADVAAEICARLMEGKSLKAICEDGSMPSYRTVFNWLAAHPSFVQLYALARDAQADTLADEILHIADNPQLGVKTKTTDKGTETTEGDMIEHRRLQVDTRKWIAARLKPKKYGDRLDMTSGGDKLPAGATYIISKGEAEQIGQELDAAV